MGHLKEPHKRNEVEPEHRSSDTLKVAHMNFPNSVSSEQPDVFIFQLSQEREVVRVAAKNLRSCIFLCSVKGEGEVPVFTWLELSACLLDVFCAP